MSDNEKSLFPDRVPVVIQRSHVEKDLQKLRMQYMSTPKDQPLSGIVEYIADKLQLPRVSNVSILVGEYGTWNLETTLRKYIKTTMTKMGSSTYSI